MSPGGEVAEWLAAIQSELVGHRIRLSDRVGTYLPLRLSASLPTLNQVRTQVPFLQMVNHRYLSFWYRRHRQHRCRPALSGSSGTTAGKALLNN